MWRVLRGGEVYTVKSRVLHRQTLSTIPLQAKEIGGPGSVPPALVSRPSAALHNKKTIELVMER